MRLLLIISLVFCGALSAKEPSFSFFDGVAQAMERLYIYESPSVKSRKRMAIAKGCVLDFNDPVNEIEGYRDWIRVTSYHCRGMDSRYLIGYVEKSYIKKITISELDISSDLSKFQNFKIYSCEEINCKNLFDVNDIANINFCSFSYIDMLDGESIKSEWRTIILDACGKKTNKNLNFYYFNVNDINDFEG